MHSASPPTDFIRFEPNFLINKVVMEECVKSLILADLPIFGQQLKFYGSLKCLLAQDHKGLEISKFYSYSSHPISAKLYEDIDYMVEHRPLLFLAIGHV